MPQPIKVQADAIFQIGSGPLSSTEPFVAAAPNGTYGIGAIAMFASANVALFVMPQEGRQLSVTASDSNPSFAFLADGTVVAATAAGDIWSVRNAGSSTTPPVNINAEAGTQNHPEVVGLEGGRHAFIWMDAATASLRGAFYSNVGVREGSILTLAPNLQAGSTHDLGMVALASGGFAATYDNAVTGASLIIVGPNGEGNPPIDFDPTVAADRDSDVALLADGRLVMVAHTAGGYRGRFFDAFGQSDGGSFAIMAAGDSAAVAALKDGRFVVVSGRAGNIYGQVMRADGTADGAEFQVNTEVGGTQIRPHLDVLADGRFVVAWQDSTDGKIYNNIWDPREAGLSGSASGLGDRWVGTGFADTLYMAAGNDSILAGDGNDLIRGEALNDTLVGEAGNDTLYGGDGNDSLNGGTGADALYGNLGIDVIFGDAGADRIYGGDGNDNLYGEADGDQIFGGLGLDVLYGGDGADKLQGGDGNDVLYGGTENDVLKGDDGDDVLEGEAGRDKLSGGGGEDWLVGGDDNDTLLGDAGNDTLIGGAGGDRLTGGAGADRFVWQTPDDFLAGTPDRITDFAPNADLIDLSSIDAVPGGGDDAFVFVGAGPITAVGQVAVRQAGGSTFLDISFLTTGVDATIRLDGLVTVDAGDLIL